MQTSRHADLFMQGGWRQSAASSLQPAGCPGCICRLHGHGASRRGDRHWQQMCPGRRAVHALHAEPASTPTRRAAPGMAGMPCLSARLADE